MAVRRVYPTTTAQVLTFHRAGDGHCIELRPADADGDVWVRVDSGNGFFLQEGQARRLARALLEAAGE